MEFEIVPRLALALHKSKQTEHPPKIVDKEFSDQVVSFSDLVLGKDTEAAAAYIHSLIRCGATLEDVYHGYLSPAARYLKHLWLEDQRYFAEITLGIWRLQQLLRDVSQMFRNEHQNSVGLRALLTTERVDAQELNGMVFELSLLGEFYRRDGWDTWIEPFSAREKVYTTVQSEWFDVCEFLVTNENRIDQVAASIEKVRKTSLNQSLGIVVYGRIIVERPELVLILGGDLAVADPGEAVTKAQHWVQSIVDRDNSL